VNVESGHALAADAGGLTIETLWLAPIAIAQLVFVALTTGITIGNQTHAVEVIVKDSQSNPNRAAEVANELINASKIDLMVVAHTPDTVNPVADACEINEVPCISTDAPWQPYFFGPQGRSGEGLQVDLSFLLGPRRRDRRLPGAVG